MNAVLRVGCSYFDTDEYGILLEPFFLVKLIFILISAQYCRSSLIGTSIQKNKMHYKVYEIISKSVVK